MNKLKQEFLLAETMGERLNIAIRGANAAWALQGNKEFPTKEFYDDFLEPFIELATHTLQMDEGHFIVESFSKKREKEHIEARAYWNRKCIQKLNGD